jgi:hypothetical protein
MNSKKLATTVLLSTVALAGRAWAINQAPHDAAHNVTCNSCHIPFGGLADPAHMLSGSASAMTSTLLTDASQSWTASAWVDGVVTFTSGANSGQFRTITANTATTLSFTEPLPNAVAAGDGYTLHKLTYDDIEVKCKACHNPAGSASSHPDAGLHLTMGKPVGCGKCHEPHNVDPNSGWSGGGGANLIRNDIRLSNGASAPVVYTPGVLTNGAAGNGVCQICHTQTAHYKNDGSGLDHQPGTDCTTCHGHGIGFGGGADNSAHMQPTDPSGAWGTHNPAAGHTSGWTQPCLRCHTSDGYRDYIGVDGSDNHMDGTFNATQTNPDLYATGPLKCETCHNSSADSLNSVLFVSGLSASGLNRGTAICAQCHEGRESTISVSKKLPAVAETTTTGGTQTTITSAAAGWTANGWANYYLLFTAGAHTGIYRKISANDASGGLTWLTPLPTAVAAGEKFVIVNAGTTGTKPLDATAATSFTNSHYLAAAAILWGTDAKVAMEYPYATTANTTAKASNVVNPPGAPMYSGRNLHAVNYGDCTSCHNQHTLEIKTDVCGNCHFKEDGSPITTLAELEEGSQYGFWGDVDGDGAEDGIRAEVQGIEALLFKAIYTYAANVDLGSGVKPICYNSAAYPYWFNTTNTDGTCDATPSNYATFSPRLLRATYNYNLLMREPGNWAHNPRYAIQLAYDGIVDLNAAITDISKKVGGAVYSGAFVLKVQRSLGKRVSFDATTGAATTESSHFDATAGAFQRSSWINAGAVNYPCSRCHGGQAGLENYLGAGPTAYYDQTNAAFNNGVAPVMGQQCTACHTPNPGDNDFKRIRDISATAIGGVRVPGHLAGGSLVAGVTGASVVLAASNFADPKAMVCSSCHQSRDINGVLLDKYLDGTYSAIDVPGSRFLGTGDITNSGGNIQLSNLPTYQAAGTWGTPNNWLYTTTCQAAGKFITISGSANYNGTYAITTCGNGTAVLNKAYVADEAGVAWSAFAAATKNVHDIQAGAVIFGSAAHVGYEYGSNPYAGVAMHGTKKADCLGCHQPKASGHTMQPAEAAKNGGCNGSGCHTGVNETNFEALANAARGLTTGNGYDGDPTTTTLKAELQSFVKGLGKALNAYGLATVNRGFCVSISSADALSYKAAAAGNNSGVCTTESTNWNTSSYAYDPKMVRAIYNMSMANPGNTGAAWFMGFDYTAQLIYDSIEDIGGMGTAASYGLTRP